MTIEELKKLKPLDAFLFWIKERWNMLQRRKAGKSKPWSDCPLMNETYFTNVRREDDKVTIWIKENIREPQKNADDDILIFSMIASRWFNYIPTMELLNEANLFVDWDTDTALGLLDHLKKQKVQIFTGAFVIATQSKLPKHEHVCRVYLQRAWESRKEWRKFLAANPNPSLDLMCTKLGELPGFKSGTFMRAQVIADLKYTKVLKNAKDWWTWCAIGPGSKKGLNIIEGRDKDASIDRDSFLQGVNRLRAIVKTRLPNVPELSAQDIQNCLCETSKVFHVLGGGRPKRFYGRSK